MRKKRTSYGRDNRPFVCPSIRVNLQSILKHVDKMYVPQTYTRSMRNSVNFIFIPTGLLKLQYTWTQNIYLGFEVLTAASTKMAVFWVVAPCSLVEVY
jgi:hypothetical protein